MTKKLSIRKKLILAILLGALVPYTLGGIFLNNYLEDWLYSQNFDVNQKLLSQISNIVDEMLISNTGDKVEMLSELEIVTDSKGKLNNYSQYSSSHFVYEHTQAEDSLIQVFELIKKSNPAINFIFWGTQDGEYVEYPMFAPSQPYDPRIRPWYTHAMEHDELVISDPYLTNMTGEYVVSMTKKVVDQNVFVGVIGITVKIEEIADYIKRIRLGDSGYIMILNERDKIVVSPEYPEWVLQTPEALGIDALLNLKQTNRSYIERVIDGKESIINVVESPLSGWKMISIEEKRVVLSKAKEIGQYTRAIYIFTFILILLMVYLISNHITQPILFLSSVIGEMAEFNFKDEAKDQLVKYSRKQDEIGMITRTIMKTRNNFLELMEQVALLNHEINSIDIEKHYNHKLSLSKGNPFYTVVESMDKLLDRLHLYVDKLKGSNIEIVQKNELLVATEEELRAQITEIDDQKQYINFMAYHDSLTGLPNRRSYIEHLQEQIQSEKQCAVALLDLDNFKTINDTLGHVFGDKVLTKVGEKLQKFATDSIFISRFGGDEFLVLMDFTENHLDLEKKLNELSHLFDQSLVIDNHEIDVRFSMGVSLLPEDSKDVNELIMYADLALYEVKKNKKQAFQMFDDFMLKNLLNRSDVEVALRDAIENDGFKLVYQPIIDIHRQSVNSYEALIRLKNQSYSPSEFISIAEETGLIIEIGRIVTRKVCKQLEQWRREGYDLKPVSINFSASQLHDHTYIDLIGGLLDKYKLSSDLIEIEITEHVFLDNLDYAIAFFKDLKALGIKVVIDDFGTGYSSLSYLISLPVDKIKLDRSINMKFLELDNIQVLDSLIALIHGLKLKVVAEGIEEREQVRRLKVGKCDYVQGYYFSKPMAAEEVFKKELKLDIA